MVISKQINSFDNFDDPDFICDFGFSNRFRQKIAHSFACFSEPLPKTTLDPLLIQHKSSFRKKNSMQIFHGNRERLFNYSSFSFEDFRSCAHDAIKDFIMNSSGTSNRMRLRFGFSVYPDRRISFLQHFSANDLIFNNIEDLVKIFTSQYLISSPTDASSPPPVNPYFTEKWA